MKLKKLGKTNLMVSQVAFGGIEISRIEKLKAVNLIQEAISLGINLIDTAHTYMHSEEIIGQAIKKLRNSIFLSTKSMSTSKKLLLSDLASSFRNLKTDYLDIFLFHDCTRKKFEELSANGTLMQVMKEKQKGNIRNIGFSSHSPAVIEKYYEFDDFSVLMMPINFVSTEFTENNIYNKAVSENIGILAMKPLGGGRLSDIQLCFKYLNKFKEAIPVIGVETIEELKQDISCMKKSKILSDKDLLKISKIVKEIGKTYCRDCRYCMPCPQGINIPLVNFVKINYKRLNKKVVFNDEYISEVRKSSLCNECLTCENKCPFNLQIVDMLKENMEFYLKKYFSHKS